MKVKVTEPFLDKYNPEKKYSVGDVVEVDEERGRNLLVRGLVSLEEEKSDTNSKKGRPKKSVE